MSEKLELGEWAKNVDWETYIDDDVIYQSLVRLHDRVTMLSDGIDENAIKIKLVTVGDPAVGKTSLLIVYASEDHKFPEDYCPTLFENYSRVIDYEEKKVYLHLWDTAGQEDFDRLRPLSYPGTDIVILCFSLVSMTSYEAVREKWYREVDHYIPDVPCILVGTKVDLRDENKRDPSTGEIDPVTTEQGKEMQKEINAAAYIEVSALNGKNVERVFKKAVQTVLAFREESSGKKEQKKESSKKKEKEVEKDEPKDEVSEDIEITRRQRRKPNCILL